MTNLRRILPPLLAVAVAGVAGCGSSSSTSKSTPATSPAPASTPSTATAATAKVAIVKYAFGPVSTTVKRGGTITFTNQDPTPHTATADDGKSFDTGTLNKGQAKTLTFDTAGTFAYHCVFHAFMKATVVVS